MDRFSFLNTVHTGFIEELYQQYLKNPDTVEPSWKSFFQGYDLANSDYSLEPDEVDVEIPQQVYKEFKVIENKVGNASFRVLDPLQQMQAK